MTELAQAAVSAANLPYTLVVLVLAVCWLIVIFGGLDRGRWQVPADESPPEDFRLADATRLATGVWGRIGRLLLPGQTPPLVFATVAAWCAWTVAIVLDQWFGARVGGFPPRLAWVVAVPNVVVSLFVAKLLTAPFAWFGFGPTLGPSLVGKVGSVTSAVVNADGGQCQIKAGRTVRTIAVRTAGQDVLMRGDQAVVTRRNRATNDYMVVRYRPQA